MGIGAVERETGLSKDTLRVWERRYRFPQPARDANGERIYPSEQVEKLRLLKRLTEGGLRPGKIISLALHELEELATRAPASPDDRPDVALLLDLLHEHDITELRRQLTQTLMRQGLQTFILDTARTLTEQVASQWLRGDLELFEERCYTQLMQGVLHSAIHTIHHEGDGPCVLLAGLTSQGSGLALLMMEAILAVGGAICIPLGSDVPAREVARGLGAHRANVVALSLENLTHDACVELAELRLQLRPGTAIWALCGTSPTKARKLPEGVEFAMTLDRVPALLNQWRKEHGR